MNKYESIIIVNPNVDEAGLKELEEKFTGLINENGKVESVENMGQKKLAYDIKKFTEDTYLLYGQPKVGVVLVYSTKASDTALNYYNQLIMD